jgi:thymidylate kinase
MHDRLLNDLIEGEEYIKLLLSHGIDCLVDRWYYSYNVYGMLRDPYHITVFDQIPMDQKTVILLDTPPMECFKRVCQRDGYSRFTLQ